MNPGILFASAAYLLWGLFPVYFKAVAQVPSMEILAHRMAWSLVLVAMLLAVMRSWRWIGSLATRPSEMRWYAGSAVLVSINWFLYIYAVNTDRVIDASLGYFIIPLVNVAIGTLFLGERLRPVQWSAVAIASLGVAWLAWRAGELPWIGLSIAFSFAGYGLLRKKAPLGSVEGFAVEVTLLFPFALGYLWWLAASGIDHFTGGTPALQGLLVLSGLVTAAPLLLFTAGARRIPFSTLGLLQYIAPTLQLSLGVLLFNEPFGGARVIGYGLVWVALAIFALDGIRQGMKRE
jgi:chloramphenicol-sensitive protein RarD